MSGAILAACLVPAAWQGGALAVTNAPPPGWMTQPLSLAGCLDLALQRNSAVLKARSDLEASEGIVIQTRVVAIPKLRASGSYTHTGREAVDEFPFAGGLPGLEAFRQPNENWDAGIRIVQSVYEGGRLSSALRTARLTREQSLLRYQTVISDTLLEVRLAYYRVLLTGQQIGVREASVHLLTREVEDQRHRYDAGTVPQFNVLRAEVELANARPKLIRVRNFHRIAKNNLANLLGCDLPKDAGKDLPLQLSGTLETEPRTVDLAASIAQALERRPELAALRKAGQLRREGIVNARGGYKPGVEIFAGYGWRNSQFTDDLTRDVHGWNAGAQLTWDLFDGGLTRGKVTEARALHAKSEEEVTDATRRVELEVRTAYSNLIEAREVLESQKKVQEAAEEALRLARARTEAGTGTQLDVLGAQTALTEARTTQVLALHDYASARARFERAIGDDALQPATK